MSIDITNHLIPYAQVKQMLATAWGEGYEACAHYHDLDTEHSAPNPYQDK